MELVSSIVSEIHKYLAYRDDSGIDRLNRIYTVALLSTFVSLVSSQHYIVGSQINCWIPQEFSKAHTIYAHDICWLGHTNYYVSENITQLNDPSYPRTYPFLAYPWLPVILIGMTVSFAAPYLLVWQSLSTRSGIDVRRLIVLTRNDKQEEELARAIHFALGKGQATSDIQGFYVTGVYLLMKTLYIINSFGQFLVANKMITGNYFTLDLHRIFRTLSVKYNMWSATHLPIETMCDFMIRMLGQNSNWYTIQCILPFNLFTERIFALLTIWFILLFLLNTIDLVYVWLWRRLWLSFRRYDYIDSLMNLNEFHSSIKNDDSMVTSEINSRIRRHKFVHEYLKIDGYLLFKFLHANSSDIAMSHLVARVFAQFQPAKRTQTESANEEIVL